ncbi:hypothetical protein [Nonomuraea sp. SBT364]|uniref:hypothetical protein n=1 Tax=Nonomuraea sp. SBT364 TaxID=1580530 RepID=UPI0012E12D42|nr:hypothetical protein [Nonomuraea sp. SBT364]
MVELPDELRVLIEGSSQLPEQTRKALCEALAEHGQEVLAEASRVAAGQHLGGGDPMITPGMIVNMAYWVRNGYIRRGPDKKQIIATVVGGSSTFVGGVFVNNITTPWGAIGFVVCAVLLLLSIHWGSK